MEEKKKIFIVDVLIWLVLYWFDIWKISYELFIMNFRDWMVID